MEILYRDSDNQVEIFLCSCSLICILRAYTEINISKKRIVELLEHFKEFLTVNFNTPELINALVCSINKFVSDAHITVIDNSDMEKCVSGLPDNVTVIDNTYGQFINFKKWINSFPYKYTPAGRFNNYGSAKHCYTIQRFMDTVDYNFMLVDSDILLKRDVSDVFIEDCIWVSRTVLGKPWKPRISPWLCYINNAMCRKYGVKFFNPEKMHGLGSRNMLYDTGASFYEESVPYKHFEVNLDDYCIHYGAASYDKKKRGSIKEFLERNRQYWT